MHSAARSYRSIGLEARVEASDPRQLVLMLFDGALERIGLARSALDGGDLRRKLDAVASAARIVEGLRQSLDLEAGGALAQRLDSLYEYVGRRLLHANIHNDAAALDEAARLLADLRSAWAEMRPPASP
jgi:flagellar secretion chaperone FliS